MSSDGVVTAEVVLSNVGVIGIVEGARQRQLEAERLYAEAERIASTVAARHRFNWSERVGFALQTQRNMLAAVGHDLRAPLAAMRISAEFVSDEIARDRLIGNLNEL